MIAIATFADAGAFARARLRAIADARAIHGEWLPYASAAPDEVAPWILPAVLIGGACVAIALFALESWSAVIAYPIVSGARPLWSWQAFLPSVIEVAAFGGAVAGLVAFFVRARLTRLHDAAFDLDEVALASQGAFVLALACDEGEDCNAALALLAEAGATHSRLVGR
jgi:hypothetical protein